MYKTYLKQYLVKIAASDPDTDSGGANDTAESSSASAGDNVNAAEDTQASDGDTSGDSTSGKNNDINWKGAIIPGIGLAGGALLGGLLAKKKKGLGLLLGGLLGAGAGAGFKYFGRSRAADVLNSMLDDTGNMTDAKNPTERQNRVNAFKTFKDRMYQPIFQSFNPYPSPDTKYFKVNPMGVTVLQTTNE